MTSKNPSRSCDDVDESVLSYAEVKALCIGNPLIKEKVDLDIQVARLRVLEGSHTSQQYQLQDKVLKYYPKNIKASTERIAGLEKDLETYSRHAEGKFSMTVSGQRFGEDEKGEAGKAIIEACREARGVTTAAVIGEYKGFAMTVSYNYIRESLDLHLKAGGVTHQVELGTSPSGNLARIDNTLEKIPERLKAAKEYLSDLEKQMEHAKEELGRPFQQAQELQEKTERLAELDILLSIDGREPPLEEGPPVLDGGGPAAVSDTECPPEREAEKEKFQPEIGQRVVFHPDGSTVKLTGKVVSIEEETVTVQAGSKIIPVYKDKGRFEPERDRPLAATIPAAGENGGLGFER
jgi:hypothetical protein